MRCSSVKRRSSSFGLTALLALGLFAACSSGKQNRIVAAPNFELKDLQGKTVTLDSFKGSPVLLDFWATWCGPCRMSIPVVQEFYMRYKSQGLVVLGMNMDDEPSGVFGFVQKYHMTYPVVFAANSTAPADYNVEGIPQFVLINKRGQIVRVYQGFSLDMAPVWEADFKAAIAEPSN